MGLCHVEKEVQMAEDSRYQTAAENFSIEIETGIFNMIVTLCQHKANFMSIEDAKEDVAKYLERLIVGLRFEEENPLKGNES